MFIEILEKLSLYGDVSWKSYEKTAEEPSEKSLTKKKKGILRTFWENWTKSIRDRLLT